MKICFSFDCIINGFCVVFSNSACNKKNLLFYASLFIYLFYRKDLLPHIYYSNSYPCLNFISVKNEDGNVQQH